MRGTLTIFKRELAGYFATPVAYVFLIIFLMLAGVFTWQIGGYYDVGQADLRGFFSFHPWLYLALIPALSMRLWAEERRSGTIELLMTLPISTANAVVGKFLAAWAFTGVALALTATNWLSVNYLGDPDNGVILASYIGSFLMAGAFLGLGSMLSSITKNQISAFVLTFSVSLLFVLAGFPAVTDAVSGWAPDVLTESVRNLSFLFHFDAITRGVVDARDALYFLSLIALSLFATAIIIDLKKAD
ncbi:ABC-2 family transporter protein [Planctomycetes bacterium Poly30]|uniref:ABC-2 family transporter protein n=1 Tax=Saltatorellus ferox TaxID=2528018 RepID=A0A518EU72_9BACT|nr:ABC-2 family transporter protein [Planctomycetes bacterium Poly30]